MLHSTLLLDSPYCCVFGLVVRRQLLNFLQIANPVFIAKVPLYRLGFMQLGFAEVGSISAEPAAGNERPRCWRIPSDQAVINCMGLNNEGAECVAARLKTFTSVEGGAPIGINIAKTHNPAIVGPAAVEDFVHSFKTLAPLADFVVINVSCPNTAEGKTFEEPGALSDLLQAIARQSREMQWERAPPILVKLMATPDSEDGRACQRELLRVIQDSKVVDGIVISNTIKIPEAQLSSAGRQSADAIGKGGVSGKVIHRRSVAAIRSAFEATGRFTWTGRGNFGPELRKGGRLPIIGVGGTDSAEASCNSPVCLLHKAAAYPKCRTYAGRIREDPRWSKSRRGQRFHFLGLRPSSVSAFIPVWSETIAVHHSHY